MSISQNVVDNLRDGDAYTACIAKPVRGSRAAAKSRQRHHLIANVADLHDTILMAIPCS